MDAATIVAGLDGSCPFKLISANVNEYFVFALALAFFLCGYPCG